MKEAWYSSIPRLITIFIAIALYGVALFAMFRRSKRIKLRSPEEIDSPPIGYSGPERRIYPRVKVNVDVKYKIYSKKSGLHGFKEGRARNISEGGVFLETYEKLAADDRLEFKLKLPVSSQFILIRGKVVWTREVETGKWYYYGISFIEIDPNDKKLIAKYIAEFQSAAVSGG